MEPRPSMNGTVLKLDRNTSALENYKIEYDTIANQKQARYNIDKKTKATATVQKIDFGCSHKEQIENRYPQWLKTLVCSAWRKLFNKAKGRRNAAFLKHTS